MTDFDYGPVREDELVSLNGMLEQALFFRTGTMAPWTSAIGNEHLRAVRRAGQIVAGLSIIPFGHWFGGRVVPTGGVTAVGVAPEARGGGVGVAMLGAMLHELHERGVPLSSLYPATTAFYRRAGYERAATRTIFDVPAAALDLGERTLLMTRATPEDEPTIKQLYRQRAADTTGFIERPDVLWNRVLRPSEQNAHVYLVHDAGVPDGYVVFTQGSWTDPLMVRDAVALSVRAGRRLLTFLADHRSVIENVRLMSAPSDPLLVLLAEQEQKQGRTIDLMVRVVDVIGALAARGYPPGLNAELHLEVTDDQLPWNCGRFVLQVRDGSGRAEPGGRGGLQLSAHALAALYTGFLAPAELRLLGALSGEEASLAAAALAFAGPRPWLPDMF